MQDGRFARLHPCDVAGARALSNVGPARRTRSGIPETNESTERKPRVPRVAHEQSRRFETRGAGAQTRLECGKLQEIGNDQQVRIPGQNRQRRIERTRERGAASFAPFRAKVRGRAAAQAGNEHQTAGFDARAAVVIDRRLVPIRGRLLSEIVIAARPADEHRG